MRAMRQPLRRCVVCRQSVHKDTLLRVRWTGEGLRLDAAKPHQGRGAYLHRSCSGRKEARATKLWEHALRLERGTITGALVGELLRVIDQAVD